MEQHEQPDADMLSVAGSELALNPSPMPNAAASSATDELDLQDENDASMEIEALQN